jgi:hypothetical protein
MGKPTANKLAYASGSPFAHQPRWGLETAHTLSCTGFMSYCTKALLSSTLFKVPVV